MKNTLFCPQIYSPGRWKSHFRALEFQNFLGKNVPRPSPPPSPLEKGDQRPLVYTVGYSIRTCWLLQFLQTPLKAGAYCERYVGTFSAFVCEKSLYHFFSHYTDHCYFPREVENEVRHLIGNFAIKFPCLIRTNFWNCVIFGNSSAKSHHAVTGPFYGVEEVLHEAFCNSNAVEAYSKTEVWSRDADLQGRNKGMLSRVKPSSPVYSLYIEHTCEEKNIKGIDSTQSRSNHINSQR